MPANMDHRVATRKNGLRAPDTRHATKQRHWSSRKAKRKTSARVSRWRKGKRKIVTDKGRQEVGPELIVSIAKHSAVAVTVELSGEETNHGIDMDGNCTRSADNPSDCDDGARRDDSQSRDGKGAAASPSHSDFSGSGGTLAGPTGPRCALCGLAGVFVRLEYLSRSVFRLGRRRSAVQRTLGPRGRSPPKAAPPQRPG